MRIEVFHAVTMRRQHNVVAATLLVLGIIYLCAPREAGSLGEGSTLAHTGAHRTLYKFLGHEEDSGSEVTTSPHASSPLGPTTSAIASLNHDIQSNLGSISQNPLPAADEIHAFPSPPAAAPLDTASPNQDLSIPTSKPEFEFQNDLDLDFPTSVLQQFSNRAPLNYDPNGPRTFAYATFMATRNPSIKDPYFLAIQSLIHRILWSPLTRTQKPYPFIVFVADFVTQEQRTLLAGAGAIVRELKPLQWHCDAEGVQKRWNDLFAKLNMWAETKFERILFLDADAFPLSKLDGMFDVALVQKCHEDEVQLDDFLPDSSSVCEPYVFAGVPQNPFDMARPNINVGSMVFSPSERMHQRLIQNYLKTDQYDCAMAEQAFLNWQFSPSGAFPPTSLERQWGGFFPQDDEEGRLKVVHEKIWVFKEGWMKREWERGWKEMVEWYTSAEFAEARIRVV
ncbi:nucleotide-diphospho-sugar transferase [Phaeosphaeria sp. MPI-PUGE-AT-0046c]|nr:nucleotide-diphospho-sugar transferase [Phaeosphaeria sp. MPI-PUGE-AT-0046c]